MATADTLLQSTINAKLSQLAYSKVAKTRQSYRPAYTATQAFMGGLNADARMDLQSAKNMEDGASMVRNAQIGVTGISEKLKHIVELANEAATKAGISPDRFGQIQDTINNLIDEIEGLAKNTSFNSFSLLDGRMDKGGSGLISGNGVLSLQAGDSPLNQRFFNLLDSDAGPDVMGANGSINLANLRSTINITNASSAQDALDLLEPVQNQVMSIVGQYSYDVKNLSNMSVLLQNQADILTDAAKVHKPAEDEEQAKAVSQDKIVQDMLMNSLTGGNLASALG